MNLFGLMVGVHVRIKVHGAEHVEHVEHLDEISVVGHDGVNCRDGREEVAANEGPYADDDEVEQK
jgi:hypothetical protein